MVRQTTPSAQHSGIEPDQKHSGRHRLLAMALAAILIAGLNPAPRAAADSFDNGTIDLVATWTFVSYEYFANSLGVSLGNEAAWEGRALFGLASENCYYQGDSYCTSRGYFSQPSAKIYMMGSSGSLELVYDGKAAFGRCSGDMSYPQGAMCGVADIARGPDGSLYVSSSPGRRVVRKPPSGSWELFAGTGTNASAGDGGPAIDASFTSPTRMAIGPDGSVYLRDGGTRVRVIRPDGTILPFAGTGEMGGDGDGGLATSATLREVRDVALGLDGNLFIATRSSLGEPIVRVVDPDGIIHHFAGSGVDGFSGDGGLASAAGLDQIAALEIAPGGELLIAGGGRIRSVDADGIINTIVGNGTVGTAGDGGPALDAELQPHAVAFDSDGRLLIKQSDRLRRVSWPASLGGVATVGGSPVGAGVHVGVFEPWPSWKLVASTFTGAGGSWSIPEIASGTYTVRFWDPWGRYRREWLGDSATYKGAATVQMIGSGAGVADVVLDPRGGVLSGQVTDSSSGDPIEGAVVWIFRDGAYVTARVSDAAGYWSIGDLPAGSYLLRFTHRTPWLYKGEWYDDVGGVGEATPVVLGADPVSVSADLSAW